MNFSNEVMTADDLLKDYEESISSRKKSIDYWIKNPSKDSERKIQMLESSIRTYEQYIKELKQQQ